MEEITNVSDEELEYKKLLIEKEQQRRVTNEKEIIRNKQAELLDRLNHINILKFIEHDCTSCSDDNPCNGYSESIGYARCKKCHLIEVLNDHNNGIHDFQVSVEVMINKI